MRIASRRVLKTALFGGVGIVLLMQAFRPVRTNPPFDAGRTIRARTHLSPQVASILDRSCMDCHSNETRWPWYSNVAPVSWFVTGHVHEARHHLNFSDWPDKPKVQDADLVMMCHQVQKGEMPIESYTWMHRGSSLTAEDVQAICDWTESERKQLAPLLMSVVPAEKPAGG